MIEYVVVYQYPREQTIRSRNVLAARWYRDVNGVFAFVNDAGENILSLEPGVVISVESLKLAAIQLAKSRKGKKR